MLILHQHSLFRNIRVRSSLFTGLWINPRKPERDVFSLLRGSWRSSKNLDHLGRNTADLINLIKEFDIMGGYPFSWWWYQHRRYPQQWKTKGNCSEFIFCTSLENSASLPQYCPGLSLLPLPAYWQRSNCNTSYLCYRAHSCFQRNHECRDQAGYPFFANFFLCFWLYSWIYLSKVI